MSCHASDSSFQRPSQLTDRVTIVEIQDRFTHGMYFKTYPLLSVHLRRFLLKVTPQKEKSFNPTGSALSTNSNMSTSTYMPPSPSPPSISPMTEYRVSVQKVSEVSIVFIPTEAVADLHR